MQTKTRSRIYVFVLSFLVWAALTTIRGIQEVIAGLIFAALVSLIAGHFLITTEKQKHVFHRAYSAVLYFFKFLWEMVKANIHVAYLVVHPKVPVKPGIVKVRTELTKDSAITVLSNSITLTPGTLTVDVDPKGHYLYVHWITILSEDIETNTQAVAGRFEGRLKEVFE